MSGRIGLRLFAMLVAAAGLLAGCTRNETLGLNGAAMMRVEVEVYKGPLSVPPAAQMGELVAVMSDAIRANVDWREGAGLLMGRLQCGVAGEGGGGPSVAQDCAALRSAMDSAEDVIGAGCYLLDTPVMRDMVGMATYLPHGTCLRYAAAWQNIELHRGSYAQSVNRALTDGQREALIDALAKLAAPVDERNRAAAELANAEIAAAKAEPGKGPDINGLRDVLTAKTVALDAPIASFNRTMIAIMGSGALAPDGKAVPPSLYDVFVRASVCGAGFDLVDDRLRMAGLIGSKDSGTGSVTGLPKPLTNTLRCHHEAVVLAVQNMASVLRAAGFRSSFGNVRYVSPDRRVRSQLTAFAFMAGEYGNQIQSRIAVLAKQLAEGREPSNLPLSDYLRDVSNTDAIHLFDWLAASGDRPGRPHPGGLDTADRVRMVERLTSDYYWRKINDVYASGQGDVTMAFIKDDIGNWSLKSFGNEPGKLLKAYRGAANAAIVSAAKLATKAANPGAAAAGVALERTSKLLSLARQFSTGRVEGDGGSTQNAQALLAGLIVRIQTRQAQFATLQTKLDTDGKSYPDLITAADQALTEARTAEQTALDAYTTCANATDPCAAAASLKTTLGVASGSRYAAQVKVDALSAAKAKNAADSADLPAKATAAIQALIDDERIAIDALQKAALPAADAAPKPDATDTVEAIKAAAAKATS